MGAAITPVCGREAPEGLEPRARARAFSLVLASLVALRHACRNVPFSNSGLSGLPRIHSKRSREHVDSTGSLQKQRRLGDTFMSDFPLLYIIGLFEHGTTTA